MCSLCVSTFLYTWNIIRIETDFWRYFEKKTLVEKDMSHANFWVPSARRSQKFVQGEARNFVLIFGGSTSLSPKTSWKLQILLIPPPEYGPLGVIYANSRSFFLAEHMRATAFFPKNRSVWPNGSLLRLRLLRRHT